MLRQRTGREWHAHPLYSGDCSCKEGQNRLGTRKWTSGMEKRGIHDLLTSYVLLRCDDRCRNDECVARDRGTKVLVALPIPWDGGVDEAADFPGWYDATRRSRMYSGMAPQMDI